MSEEALNNDLSGRPRSLARVTLFSKMDKNQVVSVSPYNIIALEPKLSLSLSLSVKQ